jgi:hypothetical protein
MSMLATLLTEAEIYDPEYGGGLCNHLPMALVALDRMGATPSRLSDYRRTHVSWLERLPEGGSVTTGAWPLRKADRAAFRDLRADFRERIAREGWEHVLRATLPELMPGLSAAAFHGLIRTAMGVAARHEGEIAAGLAYWAAHWQRLGTVLGPAAKSAASADPLPLLERLHGNACVAFDPKQAPDLIDDALLAVGALSGFDEVIHWLDTEQCGLPDLAHGAGVLYAATGDFTALHAVTGTQAAGALLPYVQEPKMVLHWLWQAMAAAYIAIGRPDIPNSETIETWRGTETPGWAELLQMAVAEEDEHTVKLCYAAFSLGRSTGNRLFRWLAAREVGALEEVGLPAWRR